MPVSETIVAITWSIQNYEAERTTSLGLPPAQIFIDAAGRRLGEFLLLICVVAQFFCGMASVTANSRMSYAFSRDGALPGSRIWRRVNPRTGTPTNSIWLCVTCSTVLVLPSLWNSSAYLAATSIAVEDPRHVRDAHHVLCNSLAMTEKHYNQARSLEASRRHHAMLAGLRASLKTTTT